MSRRPRRTCAVAIAALVAAAAGGCGTGDDRAQVDAVVDGFYAALEAGDGARACALLSGPAADALAQQEGKPCPRAVIGLDVQPGAIASTEIYIVNAKVDADSGETTFLSRERDGWRISAVACAPADGKPADRPYECEVEA